MLKTVDLSKRFGGNNLVLDGVSVAFDEASVTAIMGPSGSGKTTLLHCLSGMLRATSGKVFLDGVDITGLGRRRLDALRRTSFGFIFQDYNLIDALTAVQNVRLPSLFGGAEVTEPRAREMLALVGLSGLENRYPAELSGGQRQRVAIARALAAERRVVFADEPTGALDSESSDSLLEVLARMCDTLGQTVVMVTHDENAAAATNRVVRLRDGRIIDDRYIRRGSAFQAPPPGGRPVAGQPRRQGEVR